MLGGAWRFSSGDFFIVPRRESWGIVGVVGSGCQCQRYSCHCLLKYDQHLFCALCCPLPFPGGACTVGLLSATSVVFLAIHFEHISLTFVRTLHHRTKRQQQSHQNQPLQHHPRKWQKKFLSLLSCPNLSKSKSVEIENFMLWMDEINRRKILNVIGE